jgi:pimeloyl-ACP methyl ester carboxylesterase
MRFQGKVMVESEAPIGKIDMGQDRHIVVMIHGIRDRALWQASVSDVLRQDGFQPRSTSYGRFGLFRFLMPVPFFRNWAMREVKGQIESVIGENPNAKVSIIAHSFGTYVVARILRDTPQLKFHRVIFCGSVLRYDFPFEQFVNRFTAPILNEVGTRDVWPAVAESVTWGYGAAGTFGFFRPGIQDRWHHRAKHGYFLEDRSFCQDFWVPFLRDGTIKPGAMPPEEPQLWVRLISVLKIRNLILAVALVSLLALACGMSARLSNPTIALVDSRHLNAIYDTQTRSDGGTNNNDIADALDGDAFRQEFHPDIFGTLVFRLWADDNQVLARQPDVVILHINAFNDEHNSNGSPERLREFLLNLPLGTDVLLYSRAFTRGKEEQYKAYFVDKFLNLSSERAQLRFQLQVQRLI